MQKDKSSVPKVRSTDLKKKILDFFSFPVLDKEGFDVLFKLAEKESYDTCFVNLALRMEVPLLVGEIVRFLGEYQLKIQTAVSEYQVLNFLAEKTEEQIQKDTLFSEAFARWIARQAEKMKQYFEEEDIQKETGQKKEPQNNNPSKKQKE